MQDYQKPIPTPFRDRLKKEPRAKYDSLAPSLQDMYRTEKCGMCSEKISTRQAELCIMKGAPLICPKHFESYKEQVEKLAPLFGQLSLL